MTTGHGLKLNLLAVLPLALFLTSCAIHYYDTQTGTEHLWGIGHLKMKAGNANEGVRALITGTETLGIAVGNNPEGQGTYLSLGWQQINGVKVVNQDTGVRVEWPSTDLFNIRVGTEFPLGDLPPAQGDITKGGDTHE